MCPQNNEKIKPLELWESLGGTPYNLNSTPETTILFNKINEIIERINKE